MYLVSLKDMYETDNSFSHEAYKRIDDKETFLYFLKRYNFLVEITPLHSKARAIKTEKKIYQLAMKHWFVPTELIR